MHLAVDHCLRLDWWSLHCAALTPLNFVHIVVNHTFFIRSDSFLYLELYFRTCWTCTVQDVVDLDQAWIIDSQLLSRLMEVFKMLTEGETDLLMFRLTRWAQQNVVQAQILKCWISEQSCHLISESQPDEKYINNLNMTAPLRITYCSHTVGPI